jgi:AraC-like DNA-binding protein
MLFVDAFFRFSGIGLMLFMCVFAIRDIKKSATVVYFLLAYLSLCCYFFGFTPKALNLPHDLQLTFRILDVPFLFLIWLFVLSLFKRDFKLKAFHVLIGLTFCALIFMERMAQFGYVKMLPIWWAWLVNLFSFAFALHLLYVVIMGRNDDLIEKRRKYRAHLVYITAFVTIIVISISFILLKYKQFGYIQPTTNIIAIWPIIVWTFYALLSMDGNSFSFDTNKLSNKLSNKEKLNSRDLELQAKLENEIITKKAYLENGLSIESLAKRLGVSSYRLREFINQTLGYDNFSTFVNSYRIDAIKKIFNNPDKNHIPILTIALNNGFNSLSTFNRAFKSFESLTPSEYRKISNNSHN